jgi:hypothetical protein
MARLTVLLLVLLNVLFAAWSQGWLAAYGWAPISAREPQRMDQQVRPEALRLVDLGVLAEPAPRTPASLSCLETPELNAVERDRVQAAAQQVLPPGSWVMQEQAAAARFVVYMGPYASAQALQSKQDELTRLGLSYEVLGQSAQTPGLSLGSFASQAQAEAALQTLQAKGVRTAQVTQLASSARSWRMRLGQVDLAVLTQLSALAAALPGQGLMPCPSAAAS